MTNFKTDNGLDISTLFNTVGINKVGHVHINEHTYDFDEHAPKNHWLYAAFLGFQEYQKRYGNVSSFASIGTGAGIDAIGAYEIFHPQKIFLTDIHPQIPPIAQKNVEANVPEHVPVRSFKGDLCLPLIENKITVDLVYANIPNIPSDQPKFEAKDSASFYQKRNENCPEIFEKYLLTLQYLFLAEAKQVVNKGGAVIDAIGGRVPYKILEGLFVSNGYAFEELVGIFKIQTEPNYILKSYAEVEQKYNVEFDFYKYEDAQKYWLKIEDKKLGGPELKSELQKYRINATHAYNEYIKNNQPFGHVVHILCGKV
ncbi:MAG: hypothetical protein AAB408_03210 [Patescibacteria group bacterium]